MIEKVIILDTGPLVAFLNKSDKYHTWAVTQFSQMKPPFNTCESVISEASFLLKNFDNGVANIFKLISRDLIKIDFNLKYESSEVQRLLYKYIDVPMSLADGCLVRMSEQITNSAICTLDSDFKIYRKERRKVIPIIFPK